MKRLVLILSLIICCQAAYDQVIKGFVLEQKTGQPVIYASVYFNGTFAGTHTDLKGYFELDVSKYRTMPLSVSALGYYSVTVADFLNKDLVRIFMAPKVFELKEVTITDKNLVRTRERNLRVFKKEFLGETLNAMHCIIVNEKDLKFNYNSDNDTLKAFSDEPVVVENLALGYRITYFLDKFELDRRTGNLFFAGNIFFDEDLKAIESEKQLFERKRKNAYLGSRMHFIRALWTNTMEAEGFTIKDQADRVLNYSDVVVEEESHKKFIKYPEEIVIYYQTERPEGTIVLNEDEVFFDSNGYFDPFGIRWEGLIGRQRIGDWLPYEYEFKK